MEMDWFKANKEEIIQRLKNSLSSDDLQFIGKFESVVDKDFGFFKDVRSPSGVRKYYPTNEGEPDENLKRELEVWSKNIIFFNQGKEKRTLEDGKWYKFYTSPAQRLLTIKNKNPFLLQTDLSRGADIVDFKGNELINNIQQDSITTPESVKGKLTRSIEAISNEINTQPATFIFELIQNADDYPNIERHVVMSFDIKDPYLIIKHNGSKFEVNNAVAICDVNEGDKRSEIEKIGFKGIGFKSIFKDCNLAYLSSGDYSFRFDELKWKKEGIKLFWQITPINTERSDYLNILEPIEKVNLVIRPREKRQLLSYKKTLLEHFKDERILLFLRNVKKIDFILNDDSFEIANTAGKWKILDEKKIIVSEEVRLEIDRGISLNDRRIPLKFQGIEKTEIGFGFMLEDNKVNHLNDATIYAYLPTKVNLGFGFLLNGNFIPDGSRTSLHQDLGWNDFLFEKAGESFPKQLLKLIKEGIDTSSVLELIPDFDDLLDVNDEDKIQFIDSFKKGFYDKISEIELIPTSGNGFCKLSEIIIDETGVSSIVGEEFFRITKLEGTLIQNDLSSKSKRLIKKLMKGLGIGSFYKKENLINDLDGASYNEWLGDVKHSFDFICLCFDSIVLKELIESNNLFLTANKKLSSYKEIYDSIPEGVPLFESEIVEPKLLKKLKERELSFNFKKFDPVQFLNDYYVRYSSGSSKSVDEFNTIIREEALGREFWGFVYDYFDEISEDKVLKSLIKQTVIATFDEDESDLNYYRISSCYLAEIYTPGNEIQSLVRQLKLPEIHFISGLFISEQRPVNKWFKIFKKLGVKSDLQQVVREIIENLDSVPDENHFKCGQEIFKYWKKNKDKETALSGEQIKTIGLNLKLKQANGRYDLSSSTYISDHYTHNDYLSSILKEVKLPGVISEEYEQDKSKTIEWKEFFQEIGCIVIEDRQKVFEEKLREIDALPEQHFAILNGVSELFKNRAANNLNFDLDWETYFSLLSLGKELLPPHKLHFSTIYKPSLDIQSDNRLDHNIHYLHENYRPEKIDKKFLKKIGVNEGFIIEFHEEYSLVKNIGDDNYVSSVQTNPNFVKDKAKLLSSWNYSYTLNDKLFLRNYFTVNYFFLLQYPEYYDRFIARLMNSKAQKHFSSDTILSIWMNRIFKVENYVTFVLNQHSNFLSEAGLRRKPREMFSKSLSKWILDKTLIPKLDLLNIKIGADNISLEELIGVKQELDPDSIFELLKSKEPTLSVQDFKDLDIIRVLNACNEAEEKLTACHLLTNTGNWKLASELFYNEDDFKIETDNLIHDDLVDLVDKFKITSLIEDDLKLRLVPSEAKPTNEITEFFDNRGKYIAFEINSSEDYVTELDKLLLESQKFNFYQVDVLERHFPFEGINYIESEQFFLDDASIYFVGDWRLNNELHNWIIENLLHQNIGKDFFTNVILKSDDELHDYFNFKNKDAAKILKSKKNIETSDSQNDKFVKEVEDFISNELEGTEWSKYIIELKKLLQLDTGLGEQKKKVYNLLAKLKLAKNRNIQFEQVDENDRQFNFLEGNGEKYIVHSARGSFAYISPIELLKMRDEGYKMALDFGNKAPIKIYGQAEEILSLNTNHLLLYQKDKTIEELFEFCESNQSANKRLLIIDKDHASNKSKELLKLMIPDEDY